MTERNPRVIAVEELREAKRQLSDAIQRFISNAGTMTYDRPTNLTENVVWRERRPEEYAENQLLTWVMISNITANVARLMGEVNKLAVAQHARILAEQGTKAAEVEAAELSGRHRAETGSVPVTEVPEPSNDEKDRSGEPYDVPCASRPECTHAPGDPGCVNR